MAYDQKIIDHALDLYLEVDNTGNRRFSFGQIAEKLSRKYNKTIKREIIYQWEKRNNWKTLLLAGKKLGQEKAVREAVDKEVTITDAIANDIAERRKMAVNKKALADFLILSTLKAEAEKVKATGEENTIDMRILQTIAKNEEEIVQALDGHGTGTDEDAPINKLIDKLDSIK